MDERKILININDTLGRIERILKTGDEPTQQVGMSPGFSFGKPRKTRETQQSSSFSVKGLSPLTNRIDKSNKSLDLILIALNNITQILKRGGTPQDKKSSGLINLIPDLSEARTKRKLKRAEDSTAAFTNITKKLREGILNLSDEKDKRVSQGITNMVLFSQNYMKFAKSLTMGSLLMIPAIPLLPLTSIAIWGLSRVFSQMGERRRYRRIRRGSIALGLMGKSLIGFSIGIAAFSLTMAAISTGGFGLMGRGDDGGGFGMSMLKGLGTIGLGLVAIWGMGFIYSRLGSGMMFGNILKGSAAVGLMAISFAGFALGLAAISKIEFIRETRFDTLGIIAASLGTIGGIYAVAGVGAKFIALGALAFTAVGGSLWVLGKGLDSILSVVSKYDDIDVVGEKFKSLMANIGLGILAFVDPSILQGAEERPTILGGIVSAVGGLAKGAFTAATMLASSGAIIASSAALAALGGALVRFNKTKILDEEPEVLEKKSEALRNFFVNFGSAFAIPKDKRKDMRTGAVALMFSARALSSVSRGLRSWYEDRIPDREFEVRKGFGTDEYEGDTKPISLMESIISTLFAIQKPFELIGTSEGSERGFLGKIFRGKRNAVRDGIKAVRGTQRSLTDVKRGLDSWYKERIPDSELGIRKGFGETPELSTPTTLLESIVSTLMAIREPFAMIGTSEGSERGFLGKIFAGKRNAVRDGVKATRDTGDSLKSIAQGLHEFKILKPEDLKINIKIDPKTGEIIIPDSPLSILDNVMASTMLIGQVFAQIGEMENEGRTQILGIKMGKGNVRKGGQAAAESGQTIKNLADGLAVFATSKGANYQVAAQRSVDLLKSFITGISELQDIGGTGRRDRRRITNILETGNKYLRENVKSLEYLEKLDKSTATTSGLKSFNNMFVDMGKLPHDKIANMFKEMRLSIEEMKDINQNTLQAQLEIYKTQLQIVENEIKKITLTNTPASLTPVGTGGTAIDETGQQNENTLTVLSAMLNEIKEAMEDLNETFLTGSGKIKISNINEIQEF